MTTQIMTVEDTLTRTANSARGPFQIYEVLMGGTPYRARKPVFDLAQTLRGQQVYADTRVEQKGEWTNYFVDSLTLPQPGPYQGQPQNSYQPAQQGYQPQPAPQPTSPPNPTEKDRQIWRQTATKVAAFMRDQGETQQDWWMNVERLVWFYETGQHPFSGGSDGPPDDSIPFEPTF